MKKVIFLATGSSPHTYKLLGFLTEIFKVTIISIQEFRDESIENVEFISIKSKFGKYFSYLKLYLAISKIAESKHPDLILSLYASTYGIVGNRISQIPHVIIPIGSDITQTPFYLRKLLKKSLSNSTKIITLMKLGKDLIVKKYGVSEHRIVTIDWGVDLKKFHKIQWNSKEVEEYSTLMQKYNLNLKQKYILSPRACKPFYRIDKIIKSFSTLSTEFDYKLIVLFSLGFIKYWKKIQFLVKKLKIEDRVIFIKDLLNIDEMNVLYSLSEITISIPTRDFRPQTYFEAMACENFLIVSDLDVYKNELQDNINAILVRDIKDLSGIMFSSIQDVELRDKAVKSNLEYVKTYQDSNIQKKKLLDCIALQSNNY